MRALLLLFALLLPPAAAAGQFSDLVMAPGLFATEEPGPLLAYAEERQVPAESGLQAVRDGRLALALVEGPDGRELALTQRVDGADRPVADFPAGGANPVLLYFLETTARGMADATGGSPFYIRNRMREALGAAGLGEGAPRAVAMLPFAGDENRGRMGAFADLELRVSYDADRPGRLLELSADTPPGKGGYHHRLTLIAEE
jgi:hypothetical protein